MTKAYGIDLGTTYSAIAHINELGLPEILENDLGDDTTPSVVLFEDADSYVVGQEAKNELKLRPTQTIELIKRHMGEDFPLTINGVRHTPESISALILKELVTNANEFTGEDIKDVVITVPAYFGVEARKATQDAGRIAGLNVLSLIAEPTAAALSAGLRDGADKTILVYDLGGGTFDCTVMEIKQDEITVLASDGDRSLGGADWDNELFDLAVMSFSSQNVLDDDPTYDDVFVQNLRSEVEKAKISLTRKQRAKIPCSYGSFSSVVEVTRPDFEADTSSLVEQTLRVVDRTLAKAREKRPNLQVDQYLLVGGSSRMPMISQALEQKYGWELTRTEFDLAVAKGAAIYAQGIDKEAAPEPDASGPTPGSNISMLGANGEQKQMRITDVLPKAVGVQFWDTKKNEPYIDHILPAGTELPARGTTRGLCINDNTTHLMFHIFEQAGEVPSRAVEANKRISPEEGAILDNLPNLPKGSPVDLILSVSRDGIITLEGSEPTSGRHFTLQAQISTLSDTDVAAYSQLVQGMLRSE